MGETSDTTLGIKEPGKSSTVLQQHSTDSSASAKLVVGQRRRRPLGSEGRKAKAKNCFRELDQEHAKFMLKSTDYLRRISEDKEVSQCLTCPNCNSFPLGDNVWWVSGRKTTRWWCAICGEKYDWKQPNRLLVVQTGESVEQAKVFKAHAVPQGLCANLINALKLLANQQEDGDGLLQSIVTNLGKGSRKGLTNGLRDFIKVDNHRALDVGELHRGTGTFKVRKPKVLAGGSDVTIRESPHELTLRAEEVNTLKAYTDVNHIKPERLSPPLVDADWYAFCQALYMDIEGEDLEEMYDSYQAMSKALGVKKN